MLPVLHNDQLSFLGLLCKRHPFVPYRGPHFPPPMSSSLGLPLHHRVYTLVRHAAVGQSISPGDHIFMCAFCEGQRSAIHDTPVPVSYLHCRSPGSSWQSADATQTGNPKMVESDVLCGGALPSSPTTTPASAGSSSHCIGYTQTPPRSPGLNSSPS
jgi:hypothetical protein